MVSTIIKIKEKILTGTFLEYLLWKSGLLKIKELLVDKFFHKVVKRWFADYGDINLRLEFFFLFPFILSFLEYEYFSIISIFMIFLVKSEKIDLTFSRTIYKLIYFFFLLIRTIEGFSPQLIPNFIHLYQKNYLTNRSFRDIQDVLVALNCNSFEVEQVFVKNIDKVFNCPYEISYGPLFSYLGFRNNVDNLILILVIVTSILIFIYYLNILKILNNKNGYIFSLVMMSPPINFLIERMNFDIFIFVIIYLIYKFISNNFLKNLILLFLGFLKIYPLVLIFSNLLFILIKKNFKNSITVLIFNIISIAFFIFLLLNSKDDYLNIQPYRADRTFGILSDAIRLQKLFDVSLFLSFFIISSTILLIALFLSKKYKPVGIFEKEISFHILILYFFLSIYANYDYRLTLLIFLFSEIIKSKNNYLIFNYILFIFSSPGILHSYSKSITLIENNMIAYLDFPFYFFTSIVVVEFAYTLKKFLYKENQ